MSNTSITYTSLDFDFLKESFKQYLRDSQPVFKDYDFEGSNMNVLLDLLTYNTTLNAFYLNMIGSEMFMDSSQLRDSVVSHAKLLNYIPRSFQSSRAVVDIVINTGTSNVVSVTIPKGTTITGRAGSNNYNFVLRENVVASANGVTGLLLASNCTIYEGSYISDNFVYNSNVSTYTLSNPTIDTDSLVVAVIEDTTDVLSYTRATSLFGVQSNTQAYFLQGSRDEKYEISFGDGVVGRKPKEGAVIIAEYTVGSGELPNGTNKFVINGDINNYSNVIINTISPSYGGAVNETVQSIKLNAPKYFGTQERAITTEDFENLLKLNFPEINSVVAYGGEEVDPPQYGKVYVSVDLKNLDGLPTIRKQAYESFLKSRTSLSIEPVVVAPDYMYLSVESTVRFNPNVTSLNENDITSAAISTINSFNTNYLDTFKGSFRYSRFTAAIDNADQSILSNDTVVNAMRLITPILRSPQRYILDFQQTIGHDFSDVEQYSTVFSNKFYSKNQLASIADDGNGIINLVTTQDSASNVTILQKIGTVDYKKGVVYIDNLEVQRFEGTGIKIYARIRAKDIFSNKNTILSISPSDILITSVKQSQ